MPIHYQQSDYSTQKQPISDQLYLHLLLFLPGSQYSPKKLDSSINDSYCRGRFRMWFFRLSARLFKLFIRRGLFWLGRYMWLKEISYYHLCIHNFSRFYTNLSIRLHRQNFHHRMAMWLCIRLRKSEHRSLPKVDNIEHKGTCDYSKQRILWHRRKCIESYR